MDHFLYHMISNLSPNTTTAWRLKVRVTRMWQNINQHGETLGLNLILVDALGGRIHAFIPPQNINQLQNLIIEGETYNVHTFVVRQYRAMQTERCFRNDIYIQLYHLTEIELTQAVDFIPHHVFKFNDLADVMAAATEANFLIDVVGILEEVQPINTFRNRYNQQKSIIRFTLNDLTASAKVIFYDEMAQSFVEALRFADQHPIILIISSCKAKIMEEGTILTNKPATRFFINHHHEAVEDLRDALRLADWR